MHVRPAHAGPGLLCIAAAAFCAPVLAAQATPSIFVVEVRSEEAGSPLAGVEVRVSELDFGASTDRHGRVRLEVPREGTYTVRVSSVGYEPEERSLQWPADAGEVIDFELALRPVDLPTVEARAGRGALRLVNAGFQKRRAERVGRFVTRSDIEARRPGRLSQMLRGMPGVQVTGTRFSDSHASMRRATSSSSRCPIQYFVDGVLTVPGFNIDDIPPHSVEGIEVYQGAAQIPSEFNRQTARCGVIVIWTRID